MDVGLVAEVVESEAMDDLGADEGDDMAPVGEGACVVLRVVLPNEPGEGMAGNEVAKLPEDGQLRSGCVDVLHSPMSCEMGLIDPN